MLFTQGSGTEYPYHPPPPLHKITEGQGCKELVEGVLPHVLGEEGEDGGDVGDEAKQSQTRE